MCAFLVTAVGASLVHNNRLVLGLDHGWSAARTPPLMSTCLAWAGTSGPTHHIHVSATVDALGVWDGTHTSYNASALY